MLKISGKLIKTLIKKKISISVVESCTGGMLSSVITSIAGASKVFTLGLVTYSNNSKIKILKIPKKIIKNYGAVSNQCCKAMVKNLSKISKSNISISVTGIAGPNRGTKLKPVGLVYIGIKRKNKIQINKLLFKNKSRSYIREKAVNYAIKLILSFAK